MLPVSDPSRFRSWLVNTINQSLIFFKKVYKAELTSRSRFQVYRTGD